MKIAGQSNSFERGIRISQSDRSRRHPNEDTPCGGPVHAASEGLRPADYNLDKVIKSLEDSIARFCPSI